MLDSSSEILKNWSCNYQTSSAYAFKERASLPLGSHPILLFLTVPLSVCPSLHHSLPLSNVYSFPLFLIPRPLELEIQVALIRR